MYQHFYSDLIDYLKPRSPIKTGLFHHHTRGPSSRAEIKLSQSCAWRLDADKTQNTRSKTTRKHLMKHLGGGVKTKSRQSSLNAYKTGTTAIATWWPSDRMQVDASMFLPCLVCVSGLFFFCLFFFCKPQLGLPSVCSETVMIV